MKTAGKKKRIGRPPKVAADKSSHHIGIKLTPGDAALLSALIADEQRRTPYVTVTATSVLRALILADCEGRGLRLVDGQVVQPCQIGLSVWERLAQYRDEVSKEQASSDPTSPQTTPEGRGEP